MTLFLLTLCALGLIALGVFWWRVDLSAESTRPDPRPSAPRRSNPLAVISASWLGVAVLSVAACLVIATPAGAAPQAPDYRAVLSPGESWTVPGTAYLSDLHCYSLSGHAFTQRGRSWYLPSGRMVATYRARTFTSHAHRLPILCAGWRG